MSTIIDKLKDKFGNLVLPITNTKAVYDDNGNRLDNTLNTINKSLIGISNADYVSEASIDQVVTQWANKYAPSTGSKNLMGSIGSNDGTYHITAYVDANKNAMGFLARFTGENASFTCYGGTSTVISPFASTSLVSDAYDPSFTYSAGQYCIYNNTLWKSKVSNNLGNAPTEGTYWTATNVGKNLITTNGEGTYGYLGADDSFIPFKSGEGYTLYDDITRIAAVQGAKDLTVLENYPVKKGDLLFVCIILQSGTYYTLDHTGPQWKFFDNYLSNYGGQNTYAIQILEDGNLTMISRASSTAHYVYVRRFINNS